MPKLSKAKLELLAMIKEQRAKMDPEVLDKMKQFIEAENKRDKSKKKQISEPYNKENASEAIRLFLQEHDNPNAFEESLVKRMHKQ